MANLNKLDINHIIEQDKGKKRSKKDQHKEFTLRDYLSLLEKDPLIAQNSASRIWEIILSAGVEEIPESQRWLRIDKRFKLFSERLFGVEKPIAEMSSFFQSGAMGLSTGKQILLLVGPTASGKSTSVNILKQALEKYSLRPVFAIKGCQFFQEPLLALPRYLRKEVENKLGIKIEGDLCQPCRYMLREHFTSDDGEVRWWDVPVETFTFSIQGARGIGSFEPSDDKSSDITELVGRENIAITSTKGPDHPLAYSLSGELEKSNRGIFEGREHIKADEKLLWVFISVAEEKEIKVQGSTLPHISIDTVVIGHTNLTEYKKFASRQENEALHDRIYVVPFPYPLQVKEEIRIYKKLIHGESDFARLRKCHIAPGSLELAATFAILTRLLPSNSTGIDPLTKLKIYNGDKTLNELSDEEKPPLDIRQLLEEGQSSPDISKREGMFGVSSRDILAALNIALVEQSGQNGCLTPLKVIQSLRNVFDHRMGYSPEDIDRFKLLLSSDEGDSVMSEYKEFVLKTVSRAFLRAYNDLAKELFDKYVKEAQFYTSRKSKMIRGQMLEIPRDDITGKPKEPDTKFLRSVEEHIPIAEAEADTFRGEILVFKAGSPDFGYDSYPPLAKAVEKKLLADCRASLSLVLSTDRPKGEEEKRRIDDLLSNLTDPPSGKEEDRHCKTCAKEGVERAREFLAE